MDVVKANDEQDTPPSDRHPKAVLPKTAVQLRRHHVKLVALGAEGQPRADDTAMDTAEQRGGGADAGAMIGFRRIQDNA